MKMGCVSTYGKSFVGSDAGVCVPFQALIRGIFADNHKIKNETIPSVLSNRKIVYLCRAFRSIASGILIGESVFALSFRRNLTVSMNARITTAPSLVLACVFYANDTSVGIVSIYLHSGFVRTSSAIGESAPHFFLF